MSTVLTSKQIKLSANLPVEVAEALRELAERRQTTMTEVLRHAISLEKWVQDQVDQGSKFLVEDKSGRTREVVFR